MRLTLLARYGIDLPSELIEEQIAMALDGIVMSERHADGRRFVSSYSGVRRAASGGVELERYVTFDAAERTWTLDREPPFIAEGLRSGTLTQERWTNGDHCAPRRRGVAGFLSRRRAGRNLVCRRYRRGAGTSGARDGGREACRVSWWKTIC